MFTGLVEEVGTLRRMERQGPDARATVETSLGPLALGESVSVEGVCLTVARLIAGGFEASLSAETLEKTTLGSLRGGSKVNLERAVALGGRMGGHIVLGHVDGVGRLAGREQVGEAQRTTFWAPRALGGFIAEKGSVALDGVSLTVNHVEPGVSQGGVRFDVMLVPHTLAMTTLAAKTAGAAINVEVDVLARYVARALAFEGGPGPGAPGGLSHGGSDPHHDDDDRQDARILEKLARGGYL